MPDLPSGTVTFLFTDIEGSTRMLRHLRHRYRDVVADHHRLLRGAIDAAGGEEMGTEGDAFFVAFRSAIGAVSAAVEAQRALNAHPWPDDGQVRVRMAIHTGEPFMGDEGYIGLALHRVARLCSAGHGCQILVSNTTRQLIEDELPPEIRLRNLGEVRFKDFDQPEPIFQIVSDDLPSEFPPLKTADPQRAEALLRHREEELRAAAESVARHRPVRRRALLVSAVAGVLAAAVSIPVFALGRGDSGTGYGVRPDGNVVLAIDPRTNDIVEAVPVGSRPGDVVHAAGALWVANLDDETVSRVDVRTGDVEATIPTRKAPTALGAARDGIWIVSASQQSISASVTRIDSEYNVLNETIAVGDLPYGGGTGGIAASGNDVWVVPGGVGRVSRIDARKSEIVETIDAGTCCPSSVAVGAGAVWVTDPYANRVVRIDGPNLSTAIPVGHGPSAIATDERSVWVATAGDGNVARIDPVTNAVKTTIHVGRSPTGIAIGAGAVWVASSRDSTVVRIDPGTEKVVATIDVGGSPQRLALGAERIWVTLQEKAAPALPQSGDRSVARLNASRDLESLDPALAYARQGQTGLSTRMSLSWQLEYATCAKLMNYPDLPAPQGARVAPEVAESWPLRSPDGRTYTFTIRRGFRFSPPSNEPVTAQTFKSTIERTLDPRLKSPAAPARVDSGFGARATLGDLAGATAFAAGKTREISGLTARGDKLTMRLTRPAADLAERLALPFFCAVPVGTPIDPRGIRRPIPSAGPYYVAAHTRGQSILLRRNPNYSGPRPHRLAEIEIALGISAAESAEQIESGVVDHALDGVPAQAHRELSARYGSAQRSAGAPKQRYFLHPSPELYFLALNTSRPPFSDVTLRKAANYAIDRRELIRLAAPLVPAEPTDQYLPPGMRGFRDERIYPDTADAAAAERLVAGRRVKAVMYSCSLLCVPVARAVQARLGAVGIDVEIKEFPLPALREKLGTRGEPFDIAFSGWSADYPDPAAFLDALFNGRRIRNEANNNIAYFDDPAFNRRLDAAATLSGPGRDRAYGELDVELARDAAPFVGLAVPMRQDFFSARIGCQVYHPIYGIDIAALCIQR